MTAPRTIQECWSTFKGLKEARKSRNDYATGVWLLWCSCQRDLFSSTLCSLRPLCVGVSVWGHHLYWPYFYWFNMLKKREQTHTSTHSPAEGTRGCSGTGSVDLFRSTCQLFCVGQYSCVPLVLLCFVTRNSTACFRADTEWIQITGWVEPLWYQTHYNCANCFQATDWRLAVVNVLQFNLI